MNPIIEALESPLLDFAKGLINRVWPDPAQQAQAQLALLQLQQTGELAQLNAQVQLAAAQIGVDNTEAQSENIFKSGWRPSIGWTCSAAFAWQFVAQPVLEWTAAATGHPVALPHADLSQMMPVLLGMLGLAGLRTIERVKA